MERLGKALTALLGLVCLCTPVCAADHGNAIDAGEHVIAVVPLIGAGTADDPTRPMFLPKPHDLQAALSRGEAPQFLSAHFTLADDGKTAIAEFIAPDRQALKPIFDADAAGSITAFDPHKLTAQELNQKLQHWKKNFDVATFRLGTLVSTGAASASTSEGAN
ncbi:MAG: hypothetical protein JO061_24030 [Acidobacteriaceae bacterium]|nr:hypothetical protein [Acidobacteriaceae bacterium]